MSIGFLAKNWTEQRSQERKRINKLYSVRLSVDEFSETYQLRLYERAPNSLSFFVDKNSPLLSKIKEQEKIQIIFRPDDSAYPCFCVGARVRHITRSGKEQIFRDGGEEKSKLILGTR